MAKITIPRIEQETTITYNQAEEEADLFTAAAPFWRKLERRGYKSYKEDKVSGEVIGKWFRIPKSRISIRSSRERILSPEQQASLSTRADMMREIKAQSQGEAVKGWTYACGCKYDGDNLSSCPRHASKEEVSDDRGSAGRSMALPASPKPKEI